MSDTVEALKHALADSYTLYLKTQNYHWNVTGPQFQSLHLLFEAQYTDLAVANDELAERIRTLGSKAPGSYKVFSGLTCIDEAESDNLSAEVMVKDLEKDQHKIVNTLKKVQEAAEKAGDDVTADMAIARQQIHQKNAWMLASSL